MYAYKKGIGAFGLLKNKGYIIAGLEVEGQKIIFTNMHLPHGFQNKTKRLKALNSLVTQIETNEQFKNFDVGFVLGDFNFRCHIDKEVLQRILRNVKFDFDKLKPFDEYYRFTEKENMPPGTTKRIQSDYFNLKKLKEQPITFPPTYKYEAKSNIYRISYKHTPSYTDRIFHMKSNKNILIEPVCYSSCFDLYGSDHKPVYAQYQIRLSN